jgi:hypothetical protein
MVSPMRLRPGSAGDTLQLVLSRAHSVRDDQLRLVFDLVGLA